VYVSRNSSYFTRNFSDWSTDFRELFLLVARGFWGLLLTVLGAKSHHQQHLHFSFPRDRKTERPHDNHLGSAILVRHKSHMNSGLQGGHGQLRRPGSIWMAKGGGLAYKFSVTDSANKRKFFRFGRGPKRYVVSI